MKTWIGMLLLLSGLFSESSFAQQTHYAAIKYLFQRGARVNPEDLLGMKIGRCFSIHAQNEFVKSLVLGEMNMTDSRVEAMVRIASASDPMEGLDTMSCESVLLKYRKSYPLRSTSNGLELLDEGRVFEFRRSGDQLLYRLKEDFYCFAFKTGSLR